MAAVKVVLGLGALLFSWLFGAAAPPPPAQPAPVGEVADNQVEPSQDEAELNERARGLFEAIVSGDASSADAFWFPLEPFERLKDIPEPGKYWSQLKRAYARDVRGLHQKRKSWEGAHFLRFELGKKPKWVAPGQEVNKIGYYRSLHGRLLYELEGRTRELDVHTVITWQGHWYVTHLGAFK